jgi:hypothetical protein
MTWGELLARLDVARDEVLKETPAIADVLGKHLRELRVELRVVRGKELNNNIPENDPLAALIEETIEPFYKEPEPQKPILDEMFACLPEDKVSERVQDVVERAGGEGRMKIMARETPLILHPYDVVEVEEKDLGK